MQKRIFKSYMSLAVMLVISLSGCKEEEWTNQSGVRIEEGLPVTLSFSYSTTPQTVKTRVVQEAETEYNVNNLYLFVFNADGTLDYRGEPTITGGSYDENTGTTEGTVTFPDNSVTSGYAKRLYAIANINPEGDNTEGDMQTGSLNAIETEDDLRKLTARLNNPLQVNRLSFLMTGGISTDGGNTEILSVDIASDGKIYPAGSPTPIAKPTIYLHRIDARVTFQIKIGTIQDSEATACSISNAEFIPRNFEVHNLPVMSNLFPNGTVARDAENNYASMDETSYEPFDSEEPDDIHFNFYMFENNCVVPETDTEHYIDRNKNTDRLTYLYALREKEKKDTENGGQNYEPAQYVYAPDTATYVVIHGDLSYQRQKNGIDQYVNAAVTYTIHLGETGATEADYNDATKVNNYVVARNTHYTYTVTIQGVESIKVEVESNKEQQPGNEGDVIVAGNQVNQIDCHYGRALFKLSRTALRNTGLSWTIQTPFDKGIKLATDERNTLKDYKWVLFAINAEFGIDMKNGGINSPVDRNWVNMVKFPGYRAYDGGASTINNPSTNTNTDQGDSSQNVLGSANDRPWKDHVPRGNFYYKYTNDYDRYHILDGACLRDVNQLLNYLRAKAQETDGGGLFVKEGDDEYVYVTAFIDEYVYRYDPRIEEYISPDTSFGSEAAENHRKLLWKETTNSESRMMHICVDVPKYSEDGSSSWTESVVSFIQRPVYSIYNEQASDEDLKSAWGTESIIEGEALPAISTQTHVTSFDADGASYYMSNDNGRVNTLMFFVDTYGNSNGKKWSQILNRTDNSLNDPNGGELKHSYRDIWHACMMRNRDLDGNDIVEPEEVRWFLASIDELTDIWIGEDALPESAKLYQEDGTVRVHVASSSGSASDPWVIWAEEGASRGYWNGSHKAGGNGTSASNPYRYSDDYYYRCIRYLGISLDNIGETPDDYVVNRDGKLYVTNLGRLAKRDAADNGRELPRHTERGSDDVNKPYTVGFAYNLTPSENGNIDLNWNDFSAKLKHNSRSELCPPGYRVPNQRELMLMMTSIPNWTTGRFWSSTRFSFNGNSLYSNSIGDGNRPGFATDGANLILTRWPDSGDDNIPAKVRCVRDIYN